MEGKKLIEAGQLDQGLKYFWRAQILGKNVDWLKVSLSYEYARAGFEYLNAKKYGEAEKIYHDWIAFEPDNSQPFNNLGVVFEREGRMGEAMRQYGETAQRFPTQSDAVYNLAVLAWRMEDWSRVVQYFEEVLRRKPDHTNAASFLAKARMKLAQMKTVSP
jgi:tetratricopeptide (TPR) repeat protein